MRLIYLYNSQSAEVILLAVAGLPKLVCVRWRKRSIFVSAEGRQARFAVIGHHQGLKDTVRSENLAPHDTWIELEPIG